MDLQCSGSDNITTCDKIISEQTPGSITQSMCHRLKAVAFSFASDAEAVEAAGYVAVLSGFCVHYP